MRRIGEIALHQMRHDVHRAARHLERRQAEAQLGIHDREARIDRLVVDVALQIAFFLGDDRAEAGFAARGGQRQNRADRQRRGRRAAADVEVPDVVVDDRAHRDRLGRIDHAAAADRQNEVELLLLADPDAFVDQAEARVRLDPAEFDPRDAGGAERRLDAIEQAGSLHAAAAEVQQDPLGAGGGFGADAVFGAAAEHDLGRIAEVKVVHCFLLLALWVDDLWVERGAAQGEPRLRHDRLAARRPAGDPAQRQLGARGAHLARRKGDDRRRRVDFAAKDGSVARSRAALGAVGSPSRHPNASRATRISTRAATGTSSSGKS